MINQGPKYHLDIEGTIYEWQRDTITVPEIRQLGSLPTDVPVLQIDLNDNTQRELREDEIIEVKPGMGFSKKFRWARG